MSFDASRFLKSLKGEARKRAHDAALRAVDHFGEHVIGVAQDGCPVKTGALQNSGTTEPAKDNGRTIEKLIGFNTDYAAAAHENMNAFHPQGHAKYLEKAMDDEESKLTLYVRDEMRKAL